MTKEELMQLAESYATAAYVEANAEKHLFNFEIENKKVKRKHAKYELLKAIDAALKQARRDALEDLARHFDQNNTTMLWGAQIASRIRALKEKI